MDANAIPGYTIKKKLGAGAMAAVFLAKEAKLDRDVALKVMAAKLLSDPSFAERFLREARIVASISHRNIVTVFDVGSHGGYHFMAMELLPGGDLTSKLKKGIPLKEAISHVIDIAEGLQYAGSKDLIHRDIKPDNIMFAEDGRAVITDFGIARNTASETNMTMAGSIIGTPQYMSPEQASAEKLDHRTDLYSLGIILYEILTGSPPFKGDSAISTGVMHITQPVPLLPLEFDRFQDFIDIALAKNPEDRFQSGNEFIEALLQIDLGGYDDYEAATEIISQEDLAEALNASGVGGRDTSGLNSGMRSGGGSGVRSGSRPPVNSKPLTGSVPDLELEEISSDVRGRRTGPYDTGSQVSAFQRRRSFFPKTLIFLILLVTAGLVGHIYYVNLLNRDINFFSAANSISRFSQNTLGVKLRLSGTARTLTDASRSFGRFTGDLLVNVLPQESNAMLLTSSQLSVMESMDTAMDEGRLFSPHFDCAEGYFKELRELDPQSEVVQIKAREFMNVVLERAKLHLNVNEVDEADALIEESKRILPYAKDKSLVLKHQQIASSIVIAR